MRIPFLLVAVLFLAGCAAPSPPSPPSPTWTVRADFARAFADAGVTGVFVLFDPQTGQYLTNDTLRAHTGYLPASTFKIFNALVALETGAIADADTVMAWDGVTRSIEVWNRDHTLRTGMQYSVVWFYQEMARRIGAERMQHYVDAVGYGNGQIGGGIDQFWLSGDTRITPAQQIAFLVRLHAGDLPFSAPTMATVRDLMILDEGDGYTLRGKTGWTSAPTPGVGWFVGYLTRGADVYFFATELDIVDEDNDVPARRALTERLLADLGLLSPATD